LNNVKPLTFIQHTLEKDIIKYKKASTDHHVEQTTLLTTRISLEKSKHFFPEEFIQQCSALKKCNTSTKSSREYCKTSCGIWSMWLGFYDAIDLNSSMDISFIDQLYKYKLPTLDLCLRQESW